jgi:hypothetical protein
MAVPAVRVHSVPHAPPALIEKDRPMSASRRKTWFITGTSSGFGHAFASYALEKGYNVVATA